MEDSRNRAGAGRGLASILIDARAFWGEQFPQNPRESKGLVRPLAVARPRDIMRVDEQHASFPTARRESELGLAAAKKILAIPALPELRQRFATNFLGEIAIAKVVLRAMEKGFAPCRPLVECRYDLIVDDGLKPHRVQVKYAGGKSPKQASGVIPVGLKKWRTDGRPPILYYTAAEIDAVLVYVRRTDQILWFGPEVFEKRSCLHIRVEPARNGQQKGCLMAADYVW
jgi:hypothetical protein